VTRSSSRRLSALLLATFGAGASTLAAQEISLNRPGTGARAAGMGNAFIAVSDDGTAASWNPAGLAQLREPELSLVHSSIGRDQLFEGFRARDESAVFTTLATSGTTTDIEFASLAVPFELGSKPVTLQVGWRRLYQLTSSLRGETRRIPLVPGAGPESLTRIDNTTDGSIDLWSLAGGVRVTSRLSLGFSVDLYDGGWEERGNASEVPGVLGPTDFTQQAATRGFRGENLNLGLLLAYPAWTAGLVYHGAFWSGFRASESFRSSFAEPVERGLGPYARIQFPRSIGAGVTWRPRPLLRVAFDLTRDEWTEFLLSGAPGAPGEVSVFDNLPPELSATRNTVTVAAGLERLFPVDGRFVPLRLGFSREPQGPRDFLLRDDLDYYIVSAGTGINTNSLKFDVAVQYRWGSYRNTQNIRPIYLAGVEGGLGLPPPPEAAGVVRLQEWRIKVSVILRIIDKSRLRDMVKGIFGS